MTPRDEADRAFAAWLERGRPEDLARVFDATAPRLLLLASHLAGAGGEPEDLVQATFVRAIEAGPGRFERGRPVLPWLSGILALEARKSRRDRARRPDPVRLTVAEPDGPDALAASAEMRRELERAIAGLPEGYAQVLNLRLAHGMTPTEIGHALGMPPETVRTRIRRGVERLRPRLPVGFAAVLAFLGGAGRSLSVVRDAVLGSAGATATAATATAAVTKAVVGGASRGAVAKLLAAVAVVAAGIWGAVRYGGGSGSGPNPGPPVGVRRSLEEPDSDLQRVPVRTAAVNDAPPAEEPPVELGRFASLEGRLRDQRGLVSGVQVTLLRLHGDALIAPWAPLPTAVDAPPLVVGTAVTDSGGRFVFEAVPPGGVWLIRVAAPERPPYVELIAERPPLDERVDLGLRELPGVWETEGRVVDGRLRPVPGAVIRRAPRRWRGAGALGPLGEWLRVWSGDPQRDEIVLARRPGARSGGMVVEPPSWLVALAGLLEPPPVEVDANGRFRWRSVNGARETLWIGAPGHRPAVVDVLLSRDGAEMPPTVLARLEQVELKLVDTDGVPVVGAEVAAASSQSGVGDVRALRRFGVTGPEGTVRVDGSRSLPLVVAMRAVDGESWIVARVPAGLARTVRSTVLHPVVLRVRSRAGAPVDGVEVRMWPGTRGDRTAVDALLLHQLGALDAVRAQAVTEEDGALRYDGIPEGLFVAVVAAPGFVPRAIPLSVDGPVDVRIELGVAEELRLEAIDASFRPLRGLSVAVASIGRRDAPHVLPAWIGRTGPSAALAFPRDRWTPSGLLFGDPGWAHAEFVAAAGAPSQRLVVRAAGGLDGVLQSSSEDFEPRRWLLDARPATAGVVPAAPVLIAPDRDGLLRLAELSPGGWELATRPMPEPLSTLGAVLELLWPASEPTARSTSTVVSGTSVGFRIDPVPAPEAPVDDEPDTLRGTVLIDGAPSSAARVAWLRGGAETLVALDRDGRFDAGPVPAGELELVVRIAGIDRAVEVWRARILVDADPTPVAVDLRTAPLSARFTSAAREHAGGIAVDFEGAAAGEPPGVVRLRLQASPGGLVAFDHLPEGVYTLRVMDARFGWLRRGGVQVGGANVTVGMSIRLERFLRVTGRVADAGVEVPRTSEIELVRDEEDGVALVRVGTCRDGGAFEVDGLLPGRYRATLRAALWVQRPNGAIVLVPPATSGIVVPLTDVLVPERDVAGLTVTRR